MNLKNKWRYLLQIKPLSQKNQPQTLKYLEISLLNKVKRWLSNNNRLKDLQFLRNFRLGNLRKKRKKRQKKAKMISYLILKQLKRK